MNCHVTDSMVQGVSGTEIKKSSVMKQEGPSPSPFDPAVSQFTIRTVSQRFTFLFLPYPGGKPLARFSLESARRHLHYEFRIL
jgi:hypothetical protein